MSTEDKKFTRRQILRQIPRWVGGGLLFNAAGTVLYDPIGRLIRPVNDQLGSALLSQRLIPEIDLGDHVDLGKLIVNSFDGTPKIDLANFRLQVTGQVNKPLHLSMEDIRRLPYESQITQHVCVEGWAAIVQWGGVKLSDILQIAGVKPTARYVYFTSADGYYESWDLASAQHPQTLLAYQKNDAPLPAENGAPLRLASPIKLGYKLSKWVTAVTVTDKLMTKRGYWEDQGYDWFASI
jgi:DMSO/TMAO reductase YedYZ molybdopterin-dependent catalytic subunit